MKTLGNLRNALEKATRRLFARVKYRDFERDLAQELDAHRAMAEAELRERGLSADEARTTAARSLGNVAYMREEARAVWIARWLESAWQDVRYAGRQLRKRPVYHLGLVLILSIATVSSTLTVGLLYAGLWRPWQVHEPESIIIVKPAVSADAAYTSISLAEARHLQAHTPSVLLAAYMRGGSLLRDPNADVQVNLVSASFFSALRVRPHLGRLLADSDDRTGAPAVGVISHHLWHSVFAADPEIIGRQVQATGGTFQLVGVLEPDFEDVYSTRLDVWLPLSARGVTLPEGLATESDARRQPVNLFARMAPGVTQAHAAQELTMASRGYRLQEHLTPITLDVYDTRGISAPQTPQSVRTIQVLAGSSLFLLVIVCVNVGGLILANTGKRQRELLVRLSLGASRWRVSRQLLVEVSAAGLAAGGIALLAYRALPSLAFNTQRRHGFYEVDGAIVWIAVAVSCFAAVVACTSALGLVRRLQVSVMSSGTLTSDRATTRARGWLVGVQVALSALVLASAALLTRSVAHAERVSPGFAPDGVSILSYGIQSTPSARERTEWLDTWRRTVESIVPDAAFAEFKPVAGIWREAPVRLPGEDQTRFRTLNHRSVSSRYFQVLGIPLVEGRTFIERAAEPEAVVSVQAARRLWPDQSAIGQRLLIRDTFHVVAGVVGDVATRTLGTTEPTIYAECATCWYAVARNLEAGQVGGLEHALAAVHPSGRLVTESLREIIQDIGTEQTRGMSAAVWSVGVSVLLLALIGAGGTAACAIEERRREFGLRLALGASSRQLLTQAFVSVNSAALRGMVVGLLLAVPSLFALRSLVSLPIPADPLALILAALVITPALGLASVLPISRVARIDPAEIFRRE